METMETMVNTAHTKTTQPHHHHHQPQRATAHTDPTVHISVMQTPHQLRTVKLRPSQSQLSVSILQLSFSLKYDSGAVLTHLIDGTYGQYGKYTDYPTTYASYGSYKRAILKFFDM
jgi:hypothetical protein